MLLIDLNGKWKMKRTDLEDWIDATVPGSVYGDLLQAGLMEDPFYRDNEYEATELSDHNYEYLRDFNVSRETLGHDRVLLTCEGLDTLCDLYLNGVNIISTDNMHRTYEIDVKNALHEGVNTLHAVFKNPIAYIKQKHAEYPLVESEPTMMNGFAYLRKVHCMFGWDWGPVLPDMGIWRSISIRGYDAARLDDVYITQNHKSGRVELDLRAALDNWSGRELTVTATVTAPCGKVFEKALTTKENENHLLIEIDDPKLWWPNNLGDQPLYDVNVTVKDGGNEIDSKNLRIGLRTLTVRREKDQWGESFSFCVNGVDFFGMGGDYIPEDNIFSRLSRERTEVLIKSCVKANFNMIRVWGGGMYPEDYFFDLCDEYGLVVWQDLMYACGVYKFDEHFEQNIVAETVDNVKRLRHHASLGLWCGNNEMEVGWAQWGWSEKFSGELKADYIKQFEYVLPRLVKKLDPNTFYWASSPSSGGCFVDPDGEKAGDRHFWGVWHGTLPFTAFRDIFPRFMSEFGLQSFPGIKTVKSFTEPGDRNIFSYVMESHQKNSTCNAKILHYISETYKLPKDFESLLYASQLIQAEGIRYGVEHWRRNRGRCMGSIFWQVNDCWPVASWASIDSYGRWKALHYAAKKFFAPVLASASEAGTKISLHVSNETFNTVDGKLTWRLMDPESKVIRHGDKEISVGAFSTQECENFDFAELLDTKAKLRGSYFEFRLFVGGKAVSEGTVLFVKSKHFAFKNPQLSIEVSDAGDKLLLNVTSKAYARFVELDLSEADAIFSDNYFDLSAGDIKHLEILKSDLSKPLTADELKTQLTVRSLFDTYED